MARGEEKVDLNDNEMMLEDQTFIGEKSEKKSLEEVGTWNDWNKE